MAIIDDVKSYIGIGPTNDGFNHELLTIINNLFSGLELVTGLAGSPTNVDDTTDWPDYSDPVLNNFVSQYIQLKTRLIFDPISNVNISTALSNELDRVVYNIGLYVVHTANPAPLV